MNPVSVDFFIRRSSDIHAAAVVPPALGHSVHVRLRHGRRTRCRAARRRPSSQCSPPARCNQRSAVARLLVRRRNRSPRRQSPRSIGRTRFRSERRRARGFFSPRTTIFNSCGPLVRPFLRKIGCWCRTAGFQHSIKRWLLHAVHKGIRPTSIRAHDTQQPHLIAGELEGHCRARLIRGSE